MACMGDDVDDESDRIRYERVCRAVADAGWSQDVVVLRFGWDFRDVEGWCDAILGQKSNVIDTSAGDGEWRYWVISDFVLPKSFIAMGFQTDTSAVMFRLRWSERLFAPAALS